MFSVVTACSSKFDWTRPTQFLVLTDIFRFILAKTFVIRDNDDSVIFGFMVLTTVRRESFALERSWRAVLMTAF